MNVDGASNTNVSRVGLILINLKGEDIQYALRFWFFSTNNEVEYEALIARFTITRELGVQYLKAYSDHVLNEYEVKKENMKKYLQKVEYLASAFYSFET